MQQSSRVAVIVDIKTLVSDPQVKLPSEATSLVERTEKSGLCSFV